MSRIKLLNRSCWLCACVALTTFASNGCVAEEWHEVVAAQDWKWGEDYAYAYANYIVACEPKRVCGVATGISVAGKPLGSKHSVVGTQRILVIGIGSIRFRASDGKGPVHVRFLLSDKELASLPSISW
jgi:hypothetical protein